MKPGLPKARRHGAFDPHFWQDPIRMKKAVDVITPGLVTVGVPEANDNARDYQAEIDATQADIVAILDPIPSERRLLVTNHDAFGYFADRYDFEVIGTIIPGGSTLAEPSSAEIAELVETIVTNDVPAIFVENIGSAGLAEILAEETGTRHRDRPADQRRPGRARFARPAPISGCCVYNATAIAGALSG